MRKIFSFALVWCVLVGGISPGCAQKSTSLNKKTKSYQRKMRTGKAIPCPTKDC